MAQSRSDEASAQVASRGVPTKGRAEYVADLEKKGLKAPEASAVYDRLLASMTDSERREALGRMGEIKTNKKDTKGEKEQYDQYARVAAMRALGVKNEDELNALYGKYKAKKFAKFLDLMRKDVTSGKIPKAAAAGGGRGRRRRRRVLPQTPAPTPASPAPATGPTRRTP